MDKILMALTLLIFGAIYMVNGLSSNDGLNNTVSAISNDIIPIMTNSGSNIHDTLLLDIVVFQQNTDG